MVFNLRKRFYYHFGIVIFRAPVPTHPKYGGATVSLLDCVVSDWLDSQSGVLRVNPKHSKQLVEWVRSIAPKTLVIAICPGKRLVKDFSIRGGNSHRFCMREVGGPQSFTYLLD